MATRTWGGGTGPVDGNWNTAVCWTGDTVPGSGDDVVFDGTDTTDCDFNININIASLTATSAYTGTLDADPTLSSSSSSQNSNHAISGNVTLDCSQVDMGNSTWTVGGSWDHTDTTNFNANSSTLILTGTSKGLNGHPSKLLYNITIQSGASYTVSSTNTYATGTIIIEGTITIGSGLHFGLNGSGDLQVTSSGEINGSGAPAIISAGISKMDGKINTTEKLEIWGNLSILAPAIYECGFQFINTGTGPWSLNPSPGTFRCMGLDFSYSNSGTMTVDLSQNELFIYGNISTTNSGGGTLNLIGGSGSTSNDYSVSFNGSSKYCTGGNILDKSKTDEFTISTWIKTTTSSSLMDIISKVNSLVGYEFKTNSDNTLGFLMGYFGIGFLEVKTSNTYIVKPSSSSSSSSSVEWINDGNWHHVCVSKSTSTSASGVKIYIDGYNQPLDISANTLNDSDSSNAGDFILGKYETGSRYFNGYIDEASVWNKELSTSEIEEIYNNGSTTDLRTHSAFSSLEAWWPSGDYDLYDQLIDRTFNNYNLSMINMSSSDIVSDTTGGSTYNVTPKIIHKGSADVSAASSSTLSLTQSNFIDCYVSSQVGTGLGTWEAPWTLTEALDQAQEADRVNVLKDGTYTISSLTSNTNNGSQSTPIILRGRTSGNESAFGQRTKAGPLDTSNMPVINFTTVGGGAALAISYNWIVESIKFTSSTHASALISANTTIVKNCYFENSVTDGYGVLVIRAASVIDCDAVCGGKVCFSFATYGGYMIGSRGKCTQSSSTGAPFFANGRGIIYGCVSYDSSSNAMYQRDPRNYIFVVNCTMVNPVYDGFLLGSPGPQNPHLSVGNMITGCQRAHDNLYSASGSNPMLTGWNRVRDNTSTDNGLADWSQEYEYVEEDLDGDSQDYMDVPSQDYRLKNTSPAAGQGAFGWNDIGALQAKR